MIIRKLKPNGLEISKILAFHNNQYSTNRTIDNWIWEYKGNVPNKSVFAVAEDNKDIVGTQGMLPIYLNIAGRVYLTGKSENSLISSLYRGKNLFKNLYEFTVALCKKQGMVCIWGFTSARKVWREKLNFQTFDTLYSSYLILKPLKTFRMLSKNKSSDIKLKMFIFMLFGYLSFIVKQKKVKQQCYMLEHGLRSYDDINVLYKTLRKQFPSLIHLDLNKEYMFWRMDNNPNFKYEFYYIYDEHCLKAYCFLHKKDNIVKMDDFTYLDTDAGVFLLSSIIKDCEQENAITFFGNIYNSFIYDVFVLFKKFGFIKIKENDNIVLKNISVDEDVVYDVKNWYMNGLWGEGYA